MPRLRRSALVAAVVAVALVTVGIWLVVAGWPMQTDAQLAAMDLAQLPMSLAVLVAIVEMTWSRRLWRRAPTRWFAGVFGPGAVLLLAGVVTMVLAFALPARHLAGGAQLMIWTGVGLAFVYLAVDSVRRELATARTGLQLADPDLEDEIERWWADDEDGEDDPGEPADDDPDLDGWAAHRARPLLDEVEVHGAAEPGAATGPGATGEEGVGREP